MLARLLLTLAAVTACSESSRPASVADAAVDTAIDMVPDPCAVCSASQLCVVKYDGVCQGSVSCVARTVDCPNNACSPACRDAYCDAEYYQCDTRGICGGEPAHAFACYGP